MFTNILLATDGSAHAERAAQAAVELAQNLSSDVTITIIHVSADAPSRSKLMEAHFDVKSVLEAEAHRAITKTEDYFKTAGVPYQLKVALGDPADQIVELAAKGSYDMIVIGSRGLNVVSEVLMGSVSRKVSHHAKCPVLIVKIG